MNNTLRLFDLGILNQSKDAALDQIFDGSRKTVAFLNAHCINIATYNVIYRWALSKACLRLPDGSGLQLAAKFVGARFAENLNGTDLFPHIIERASNQRLSVFFLGSKPGVAAEAAARAKALFPNLMVAGTRHGYFNERQNDQIIDEINSSGAEVLLVALGVPMQDIWIARNRHRLKPRITFGVGAQFDFWSGRVSRAPQLLRKTGLEWTWRLAIEPRRMFKRYVLGNPIFVARSLRNAYASRNVDKVESRSKRLLDLVLAGGALLAASPVLSIVALAIKLESSGPVFFRQTRIGKNGKPFTIYKFRSMYSDAEKRRAEFLELSDRKGICFKLKNDPRVTRVGKILRRFSIDEVPQLINVWKGQMSIVGPRPALPTEVAAYPDKALGRLAVKPGLTGLWQISGRSEISFDRMINMDLAYARSRSLVTDLAIISLTFRAIISGKGAH